MKFLAQKDIFINNCYSNFFKSYLHVHVVAFFLPFSRKSVIAGMTAGAFGQFIASPTDLVKVQMQMEGKRVILEGRRPRYGPVNGLESRL